MLMPGIYLGGDGLGPLEPDGSNFPCTSDFSSSEGEAPTLSPGEAAHIQIHSSAVHGGGSCQISITYDQPPNKQSIWKVMKSFEGGCPMVADGNLTPNPVNVLRGIELLGRIWKCFLIRDSREKQEKKRKPNSSLRPFQTVFCQWEFRKLSGWESSWSSASASFPAFLLNL